MTYLITSSHLHSPVKPKLDLLKTCVAAIPRIMPSDMTRDDLIDLLSRLAIHMDHELVRTTFNSLQNIITNFPSWRHHVTKIFALFILRDIPDSCPLILEAALKKLIQMVTHWKSLIGSEAQVGEGGGAVGVAIEVGLAVRVLILNKINWFLEVN